MPNAFATPREVGNHSGRRAHDGAGELVVELEVDGIESQNAAAGENGFSQAMIDHRLLTSCITADQEGGVV